MTQCQVCCSAAQEGTAGRPDFKALPSTHSLRSAARGGDKDGPLPKASRDGRGSKRAEVPLGTAEEEPFRQGPLGGQEQGVLGETRRKVLEIMCPREGKEQDQNTLRGTGMTQRRAEWKRAPHQLPAACPQAPSPPLHPMSSGTHAPWSGICPRSKASWCLALGWEGAPRANHTHGDPTVGSRRLEG